MDSAGKTKAINFDARKLTLYFIIKTLLTKTG